ncbi:MAG: hypothetical protein WDM91_20230 [Rhizomicrobium sp.]
MSDIKVLIVVDGIFSLTTTYPIDPTVPPFGPESDTDYGPDAWFTLSHLINTLRNWPSPTFTVDTASRGFNASQDFDAGIVTNSIPDPDATIKGPDPSNPTPFHFDDPGLNLLDYDEIWLFGFEGYDGGTLAVGPVSGTLEPGRLSDGELTKITEFMNMGGGVFATGDHSGLGAALSGFIPRVRYMRKWFEQGDSSTGLPPNWVANWPGGGPARVDTLQKGATDSGTTFFFDDQSDDIPQQLTVLVSSHPAIQGATGPLTVYPDHMHEGEVMVPAGAQLTQTFNSDATLSFAGAGFVEFPTVGGYQEPVIILAQSTVGTPGPGGTLIGHVTEVPQGMNLEDVVCENKNFSADTSPCNVRSGANANNTLAAYDGHNVNVGRVATDSSFHHFLDLNLLGDPCSLVTTKQQGFNASPSGKAVLKELEAFYANLATWLAWTDRKFYFGLGKNNYGRDEVSDQLSTPIGDAFYLFLEGFTPNVLGNILPQLSGGFTTDIPGLQISHPPTITYELGNTGTNANVKQRIRFEYAITFDMASLSAFPDPGDPPNPFTLDASIAIGDYFHPITTGEFFLLGGADPYFTNINVAADNHFYLSQDLRVFTVTPTGDNQTPIVDPLSPVPPVPFQFQTGGPATQDTGAAYTYIQELITWLNKTYGYLNTDPGYTPPDTNISDPLDTVLPQQTGALLGDSSATPKTGSNINYNFAVARVRLQGSSGPADPAPNVKVFFRMFTTQTFDTDFINATAAVSSADPNVTYPPGGSNPSSPLPGTDGNGAINGCSLPFFATANFSDSPTDYAATGANNQTITIPNGQNAWAFYGCFLNVNDATNQYGDAASPYGRHPVQYWLAGSAHNCLVAQIAYEFAPIENANGVIEYPGNSDKLAQRNLQVTTSGNPGFPTTHRVPQTIDVRPSPPPQSTDRRSILSYPDEIMIDWGTTPRGSVAKIYWPELSAERVLDLAKRLYPTNTLSAADANTIQCEVVGPVTYIPIPFGAGGSFAGLMTIDLPASVREGNEFNVLVRRISTKQVRTREKRANDRLFLAASSIDTAEREPMVWRYVSGAFLAKISVERESRIVPADENLLAILKWRLGLIGSGNRWYKVLLRYISYLSGRINGMGGNASKIPPSPGGYQPPSFHPGKPAGEHRYTGKIIGIRYDRFGDFEGFTLLSETGREHRFRGREPAVEELVRRAWIERSLIGVIVEPPDLDWPASIVLDRWK